MFLVGMHMDDGIGRTGYRLLAMLFTALGLLGVAAIWLGVQASLTTIAWSGLGLSLISFVVLLAFTMVTPNTPRMRTPRRTGRSPRPPERSVAQAPDRTPIAEPEDAGPGFEYEDAVPAATAAPTELVVPSAFADRDHAETVPPSRSLAFKEHDPAAWPGQKTRDGKSHWTVERQARDEAARRAAQKGDPSRFAEKYTRNTPVVRDILTKEEKASVPPDGKTRGKCGQCGTVLLAPAKRPLKLRCPTCSKVTLLKA